MSKLIITLPHTLTEKEALRRIKTLLKEVKTEYADKITELHETWKGGVGTFDFKALSFSVHGTLTVTKSDVELIGTLPFAAIVFKRNIEAVIRKRAKALLAK